MADVSITMSREAAEWVASIMGSASAADERTGEAYDAFRHALGLVGLAIERTDAYPQATATTIEEVFGYLFEEDA